jgi:hypothetical protein
VNVLGTDKEPTFDSTDNAGLNALNIGWSKQTKHLHVCNNAVLM